MLKCILKKYCECVNWINRDPNTDLCRVFVYTMMNITVSKIQGIS
jgi:hypothetical protein